LLPDLNLCELEMLVPFRMHIRHIVSLYLNQHDMWFPDSRPRVPRLFRVRCRGSAPIATRVRLRALSGHALFTISDETFSDCLHAVSSLSAEWGVRRRETGGGSGTSTRARRGAHGSWHTLHRNRSSWNVFPYTTVGSYVNVCTGHTAVSARTQMKNHQMFPCVPRRVAVWETHESVSAQMRKLSVDSDTECSLIFLISSK
jgi:hypothetical protein